MRLSNLLVLLFVGLLATPLFAEGTKSWEQSRWDDFQKGTAEGVAIRSQGVLELAPSFRLVRNTPSTYLWDTATDAAGNLYVAAGAPARVYRITPAGEVSLLFEPEELQVQALAVTPQGTVFAATSPDGKVYRIQGPPPAKPGKKAAPKPKAEAPSPEETESSQDLEREMKVDPAFTSAVFFEPGTKYIWDLALDSQGRLYVATGDSGQIFRVDAEGKGSPFFKSDEAHIRVLAFDPQGNLIAGSDGSGLVYRISPEGQAFVLYSAAKKEITALAVDPQGNIFAAGVGEKPKGSKQPADSSVPGSSISISVGPSSATTLPQPEMEQQPVIVTRTPAPSPPASSLRLPGEAKGSEVYRIAHDGAPRRIWASDQDIVYALAFDGQGHLLAGTGNQGRILAISGPDDFTALLKASASQVTSFSAAPDGGLYAATANLGKIFRLGPQPAEEGTFESDVFDAGIFSRWGRLDARGSGSYELSARSGNVDNPDRNWSPWSKVQPGSPLDVPPARFIQWRALLRPAGRKQATELNSVAIFYRSDNVAPEVSEVVVQPGARFQPPPKQPAQMVVPIDSGDSGSTPSPQRFQMKVPALRDPGSIAVRWSASDENDDRLVYFLYYRGDQEREWKLLAEDLEDFYYSWESDLLPDGGYRIRVVASDLPSHVPDDALTGEKESARFEIDNTPPAVEDLNAALESNTIRLTLAARDSFSPIKRAEYSLDAGRWQFIEPVGKLSDSRLEHYDVSVPVPSRAPQAAGQPSQTAPEEHTLVVRVYDWQDNVGTAKAVVRKDSKE